MNILLWPAHYLPQIGGLEVLSHHLALELKKNGHSLLVLANHFHKETKRHYSIDGIDVVTFPFLNTLAYYDLRSIKEILSSIGHLIHSFHPDIIHIHGWLETFCFYQSRTLNKIRTPVCLTIHGLLEQSHYETENCMKVWKRANCITAVSDAMIESLRQYQFQHLCIERIYNGLPKPTKPHQPLLTQHKLVMIGRLAEEKYFHIAFHALKKLAKTFPNLQLTLVGDGVEMQKLCRLRMDLGLEKQIHMTGFVHPSEIDRFIDEASIVLIPSSYESFSLVALQAAFRKRPVIAPFQ